MDAPAKILIVDDDWDFIEISRFSLEAKGYRVLAAESAEEGWKTLEKEKPDLILMDLMMEDLDSGDGSEPEDQEPSPNTPPFPFSCLLPSPATRGWTSARAARKIFANLNVDDFRTKPIKGKAPAGEGGKAAASRRRIAGP